MASGEWVGREEGFLTAFGMTGVFLETQENSRSLTSFVMTFF